MRISREEGFITILETWPSKFLPTRLRQWAMDLERISDGDEDTLAWCRRLRLEAAKTEKRHRKGEKRDEPTP